MSGDYDAALAWQAEQHKDCPGCGIDRAEAWVWHESEQHAKYEHAKSSVGARLCVYCKAKQVDQDRMRESGADLRGLWWTVEGPKISE